MTQLIGKLSLILCKIKKEAKQVCIPLSIVFLILSVSGCQLLNDIQSKRIDYSHYYLWIKSLTEDEIGQEIEQKIRNKDSGYPAANLQLIMLYSLPNSPVHNPYTAKTILNDYPLAPYIETTFSTTDLAFIVMLKDQLNQQLLLLEQLTNYQGAYRQSKKFNDAQQLKIDQLNKQIIQLKKIEKTISKRGQ